MSDLLAHAIPAVGVLTSKEELIKIIWMAGYRRVAGRSLASLGLSLEGQKVEPRKYSTILRRRRMEVARLESSY